MKPRSAVAVVLLAALAWVVTARTRPTVPAAPQPPQGPVAEARGAVDILTAALAGIGGAVTATVGWVSSHPWLLGAVLAAAVLARVFVAVRAARPVPTDPQRLYSADQRREAFARAGGQCEYPGLFFWTRCPRPAEHADHLHPWSKGGATSLENCVASCASCNTSKGAKILPRRKIRALERRRRRYFPAGVDTKVGQRFDARIATRA